MHCEVGTAGADFRPEVLPAIERTDRTFRKGEYEAAYSGFEGKSEDDGALVDWLRSREVSSVDVCGIATDFCVKATALDAKAAGFDTTVLLDLTAGVSSSTTADALRALRDNEVGLTGTPVVEAEPTRPGRWFGQPDTTWSRPRVCHRGFGAGNLVPRLSGSTSARSNENTTED